MYRSSYSNRGGGGSSSWGSSWSFSRGSGRGSGRGGFRGGSRGNSNRNWNSSGRSAPSAVSQSTPETSVAPRRSKPRLFQHCFLPKQVFRYFNPSATDYNRDLVGTINSSEENPNNAVFALIYAENQPQWMTENTVYVKSRLHLLPEYAEKHALLVAQHKEPTHEKLMARITAKLTESIRFDRYGIDDGPDVECFDEDDNITSLLVPGDWMPEVHELPTVATVDTPSVKYRPPKHDPIAVYAGYGSIPDVTGFKFISWFSIEEIELFAANSSDLARRMQAKKWTADMGREWAAVKLVKVEKGEPEWRPSPDIRGKRGKEQETGEKGGVSEVPEEGEDSAAGCATVAADEAGNGGEGTVGLCEEEEQEAVRDSETSEEGPRAEGSEVEEATVEDMKGVQIGTKEVKEDRTGIEEARVNHAEVHKDGIKEDENEVEEPKAEEPRAVEKLTGGDKAAAEECDVKGGETTAEEADAGEIKQVEVKAEEARTGEVKEKEA